MLGWKRSELYDFFGALMKWVKKKTPPGTTGGGRVDFSNVTNVGFFGCPFLSQSLSKTGETLSFP